MKRPSLKTMLGLGVAGTAVLAACWAWQQEPAWKGKRLGAWLTSLDRAEEREEAAAAIRAMGPRALPYLIRELKAKDPPWKKKLMEWAGKQRLIKFQFVSDGVRRERAVRACALLGPAAKPAIPALGVALGNGASRALEVLKPFGTETVPALGVALTNAAGCGLPYSIALSLSEFKGQARLAVTNLAWELEHHSIGPPRSVSARALAQISLSLIQDEHQPDCAEVVYAKGALLRGLSSTNLIVRRASADALALLRAHAAEATTPLRGLFEDPEESVRKSATNALLAIAPRAFTFAPQP